MAYKRPKNDLVFYLASGHSVANAARLCNVTARTVHRRLKKPEFSREVDKVRRSLMDRAVGRLASTMARASSTLRELLDDQDADVRLRAAKTILECGLKLRDALSMESRLAALEEAIAAKDANP